MVTRSDTAHLVVTVDRIIGELVELRARLEEPAEPSRRAPLAQEFLEPAAIATRLGLSTSTVRRECARGHKLGLRGIELRGEFWFATMEEIKAVRAMRGLR